MAIEQAVYLPAVISHGVTKAFGEHVVLRNFSLEIKAGEFVAMLGRSGSGKSTYLRVLGALDGEVQGKIRVPQRRAIVFQEISDGLLDTGALTKKIDIAPYVAPRFNDIVTAQNQLDGVTPRPLTNEKTKQP